jgi:hypothetical protein
MALIKQSIQPTGISPEYWRILSVKYFNGSDSMEVEIGCYLDADARQANKSLVVRKTYQLQSTIIESNDEGEVIDSYTPEHSNPVELGYLLLKNHRDFIGAEDD